MSRSTSQQPRQPAEFSTWGSRFNAPERDATTDAELRFSEGLSLTVFPSRPTRTVTKSLRRATLDHRLARTTEERLGAFRVIHNAYVRAGLGEASQTKLRVTPHQIQTTSQIFVGVSHEEVMTTVSLIGDGDLGLPMETMFGPEVQELRAEGERLAEVSCLADQGQDGRRYLVTFRELTRLMAQFARYEGIGNLLITVAPRHVEFYTKYLGFLPMSRRIVACPHVQNGPAVALRLEFARIDRERPACYDEYFGAWLKREELRPYAIGRCELELLSGMAMDVEMGCMFAALA